MEIKVIESGKGMLKLEIIGEDHTFCNVLRKDLWQDKNVEIAGYSIKHSLIDNPILIVESDNPKKSIGEAVKRLRKSNEEFLKSFKSI